MKELGIAIIGAGTLYLVYQAGKRKGYKQGVCDTMNEVEKWLQRIIIETKCNED